MRRSLITTVLAIALASLWAVAQTEVQTTNSTEDQLSSNHVVPVYKVTVIGSTVKAINYRNRESTQIGFQGTSLLAPVTGSATVENKQGATRIHAIFKHLEPAAVKFQAEYLTYVLWAITPDGRPANLGELLVNDDGNARIDASTNLQAFGLIVTAEPYFAVTRPSQMVVAENVVLPSTTGTIEQIEAKFELLKRGEYTRNAGPSAVSPIIVNGPKPIDLYEAQNAIRIARWAGAEEQAADTLSKAQLDLQNADQLFAGKQNDKREVITLAREAVETAEDARIITLNKLDQQKQAEIRQNAEQAQNQAQQAQNQAEQAQAQADQAQAQAAQAQSQAQAEAQARAEAQAARDEAEQQAQQASQAAENAQQQAQLAEQRAEQMRARLLQQLNTILQTEDTQRGLMVRMSDVLFDPGRYELTIDAKLALAKMAGVLLAYPGLKLEVDGYTDTTGGEEFNQTLSDKRAEAVRTFLVQEGVSPDSIVARGFGPANPIASNDTAQGRKLNRRVDMIVSGSLIGTEAVASNRTSGQ
jgi:outer membrane protein OmpA-like peptidoglycan-associated protein